MENAPTVGQVAGSGTFTWVPDLPEHVCEPPLEYADYDRYWRLYGTLWTCVCGKEWVLRWWTGDQGGKRWMEWRYADLDVDEPLELSIQRAEQQEPEIQVNELAEVSPDDPLWKRWIERGSGRR